MQNTETQRMRECIRPQDTFRSWQKLQTLSFICKLIQFWSELNQIRHWGDGFFLLFRMSLIDSWLNMHNETCGQKWKWKTDQKFISKRGEKVKWEIDEHEFEKKQKREKIMTKRYCTVCNNTKFNFNTCCVVKCCKICITQITVELVKH